MRPIAGGVLALLIAMAWYGCGSSPGPDIKPPATPTGFQRVAGGDGENALAWTANREKDLAGYKLYRAEGDPANATVLVATVAPETTRYADTNLDYAVQFYYTLTSFDDSGNESDPTEAILAVAANLSAPSPPTNVHAAAQNMAPPASITVSWSPNTEADLEEYWVYRSLGPGTPTGDAPYLVVLRGTTVVVDSASVGVRVYYRVLAVDRGGYKSIGSQSQEVSDVPLAPVQLTSPGENSTAASTTPTLSWARAEGATGYVVIVSTDPRGLVQIWSATPTSTTTSVTYGGTALTSGLAYYWQVGTTTVEPNRLNSISDVWKFVAP
jgi:large repetitive protein